MSRFQTNHYALSLKIDDLLAWAQRSTGDLDRHLKYLGPVHGPLTASSVSAMYSPDLLASPIPMEHRLPIFCFSGFSGIGHSVALASAYLGRHGPGFGMLYVRKQGEHSHGAEVEKTLNNVAGRPTVLVFVDDIVSSGDTRSWVMYGARKHLVMTQRFSAPEFRYDDLCDKTRFIEVLENRVETLTYPDTYLRKDYP